MTAIYIQRMSANFPLSKPLTEQARSDKAATPPGDWAKLHTLVNSWLDLEYGICCINSPSKLAGLLPDNFFESVGISIYTLYRDALQAFHNQFPQTRTSLSTTDWESKFVSLRDARYPNYHFESDVYLPQIGALAIFEGQARFTQLQFLHNALGGKTSLNDWRRHLHGIYIEALQYFVRALEVKWPERANDSMINTFLLLCDIALNPSCGFPDEITTFKGFIEAVHPGHRFVSLCKLVAQSPQVIRRLSSVSRDAYVEIVDFLCKSLGWATPLDVARRCLQIYLSAKLLSLLEKTRMSHDFVREPEGVSMSMPIRLAAARQVGLLQDKLSMPELFCWTGHYLGMGVSGDLESVLSQTINKHPAPFAILQEYQNGPIVYLSGIDTSPPDNRKIREVVEQHFGVQTSADVLRQTVARPGGYVFNYLWDNPNMKVDWHARARRTLKTLTGRDLESITIL
jgi:hypothetical protein